MSRGKTRFDYAMARNRKTEGKAMKNSRLALISLSQMSRGKLVLTMPWREIARLKETLTALSFGA